MLDSKDDKTWQALRLLLDDESVVVRERLANWFHTHRERAIPHLQEWTCDLDRGVASGASRYLRELVQEDPVADFSLFIESQRYELETGIILLNRTVSPSVTVEFCSGELNQLAARCRDLLVSHHTPREVCKVISRVLFHEEGFRSNVEEDHNPANSLIREVLVSRKGLPLTLGVLYILIADRLGLELEPVCMPGRFVVGCFLESMPFYIDVAERGTFGTPEDLYHVIWSLQIQPEPTHLAPSSVREVLERCCRNLVHQYLACGDDKRSQLFARYVHEFETIYRRETNF